MEEIQSTEIIDREILEDARKKAWRILKTADDTIKAQSAEWEQKTNESLEELRRKYDKRKEMAITEINSRLPMEQRRIKAQTIDRLLNDAVHTWYAGLDRLCIIKILKRELEIRLAGCREFLECPGRVLYCNLSRAETEGMLASLLPGAHLSLERCASRDEFPSLILDNAALRICVSIKKAVDFFLLEKRAELITALAGFQVSDSETSESPGGGELC